MLKIDISNWPAWIVFSNHLGFTFNSPILIAIGGLQTAISRTVVFFYRLLISICAFHLWSAFFFHFPSVKSWSDDHWLKNCFPQRNSSTRTMFQFHNFTYFQCRNCETERFWFATISVLWWFSSTFCAWNNHSIVRMWEWCSSSMCDRVHFSHIENCLRAQACSLAGNKSRRWTFQLYFNCFVLFCTEMFLALYFTALFFLSVHLFVLFHLLQLCGGQCNKIEKSIKVRQ